MPPKTNDLFQRRPDCTIEALKAQQDTLTTLTYVTTATHARPEFELSSANRTSVFAVNGGFADFQVLEEVTLIGHSPAFERCVMSTASPPNLKRLAYKSDRIFLNTFNSSCAPNQTSILSEIPFLRAPSASMPKSLERLDITYSYADGIPRYDLGTPGSKERTRISNADEAVSKLGIALRVYLTFGDGTAWYYPPYLYGEREPRDGLVFEKDFVGPFRKDQLSHYSEVMTVMRLMGNIGQF